MFPYPTPPPYPFMFIPEDLRVDLDDALEHYGSSDAAHTFMEPVAHETHWTPDWPRRIIRFAERFHVCVDGERYLRVLCTDFKVRGRVHLVRFAVSIIRDAILAVHEGRETPGMTGEGIHVWKMADDDGEPKREPTWGQQNYDPFRASPAPFFDQVGGASGSGVSAPVSAPTSAGANRPLPSFGSRPTQFTRR